MTFSIRQFSRRAACTLAFPVVLALSGCTESAAPAVVAKPVAPVKPTAVRAETLPDVKFVNVTKEAGITFAHVSGATGEKLLPETMGSGAAFLDYDGDGDQDLLFVNSDYWPG